MSAGCPLEFAGEDDAEAIFGAVDDLDDAFDRVSTGGC